MVKLWKVIYIDDKFQTIRGISISHLLWSFTFFKSWSKYKKIRFGPLVRLNQTHPTCWRFELASSKSWCCWMCFVGGEMDWMTNPTMKIRMSHHLLDHKNQRQNNEKSTNPILSILEANGTSINWRRPWMQLKEGQLHWGTQVGSRRYH
jgi:hypothetical protein